MADRDAARDAADRRIIEAIFSPAGERLTCGHCGDPAVASNSLCPGCGAGVVALDWEDDVVCDAAFESYIRACRSRGLTRRDGLWTLPEPTTNDPVAEIARIAESALLDGPAQ